MTPVPTKCCEVTAAASPHGGSIVRSGNPIPRAWYFVFPIPKHQIDVNASAAAELQVGPTTSPRKPIFLKSSRVPLFALPCHRRRWLKWLKPVRPRARLCDTAEIADERISQSRPELGFVTHIAKLQSDAKFGRIFLKSTHRENPKRQSYLISARDCAAARRLARIVGMRLGSVRPKPHSAATPKSSTTRLAAPIRARFPASSLNCSRPRYKEVPSGRRQLRRGAKKASVACFGIGI
jgi:hypothetical protein